LSREFDDVVVHQDKQRFSHLSAIQPAPINDVEDLKSTVRQQRPCHRLGRG
jgi:hypothetical protein